jgi:hypothetical protein
MSKDTLTPKTAAGLTPGQLAYEQRRAAKAGMSLDKYLAAKAQAAAEAAIKAKAVPAAKGFFSRLLDKAHKPL